MRHYLPWRRSPVDELIVVELSILSVEFAGPIIVKLMWYQRMFPLGCTGGCQKSWMTEPITSYDRLNTGPGAAKEKKTEN